MSVPSALSARQLAELVEELGQLVAGLVLRDVQALPPRDLLLVFEKGEHVERVRLSANADGPRLHVQVGRVQGHKGPLGPFYRELTARLPGARLARISQVRGDRMARLEFRGAPADGSLTLLAELTGRHSNLLLLSAAGKLEAILVEAPPKAGKQPRLALGQEWQPPPGRPPSEPGPSIVEAFPPGPEGPARVERAPLSWIVENALGAGVDERGLERARKELVGRIERKLRRARRLASGLEERERAASELERVRMDGELLKARLGGLPRGASEVLVEDWFTEGAPERRIALDPRLDGAANLERLFTRAKKLERAQASLERERELAVERIAGLEALLARVPLEAPELLEREAVGAGLLDAPQAPPQQRGAPAARLPYKRFLATSGAEVWVGRSARDNDELSMRRARGNDVWLHTADAPGSHVVLRTEKGSEPSEEDVQDAAQLAVHFSPLRGARRADVHVARCKEVHKPRGAKPGLVTLSGGRTRHVRLDEQRLRRLLSPERAAREAEER